MLAGSRGGRRDRELVGDVEVRMEDDDRGI